MNTNRKPWIKFRPQGWDEWLPSLWRMTFGLWFGWVMVVVLYVLFTMYTEHNRVPTISPWVWLSVNIFCLVAVYLLISVVFNENWKNALVTLALFSTVVLGAALNVAAKPEACLLAAIIFVATVVIVVTLNKLPEFAAIAFCIVLFVSIVHNIFRMNSQYSFLSMYGMRRETTLMQGMIEFVFNPFFMMFLFILTVACGYFPRYVNWRRMLLPNWNVVIKKHAGGKQGGFTLIELLICIAILGIIFGQSATIVTTTIAAQRESVMRGRIHSALDSEMTALMAKPPALAAGVQQPLPIPLDEFGLTRSSEGWCVAEASDQEGLARLEVHLRYQSDAGEKQYRLIALRRVEAKP
ncbi:MAG: prepilin-type N-terminal cleavage/methylation domain-containing protein [bacterium]|nr:prepilin-type N-terminal cleavage/methylation domain-containing protein [bacterium]